MKSGAAGTPEFGQGSPHGQDVAYVFQHKDGDPLSIAMGQYWSNFAKYGDPNGEGLPVWPAFTTENAQAMHLTGPVPAAGPVASEESMKVLDTYFTWRRTDEGKAWAQ